MTALFGIVIVAANLWAAFFASVLPAANHDFRTLHQFKGDPRLVHDCSVFETGGPGGPWKLRCALAGYDGQAAGPMTADGTLMRDLTAALPGFKRGKNMMGEPQWRRGNVSITVVFDGVLIAHGDSDI